MQDALVEMSRHSLTRLMLKRVGLRAPQALLRSARPWSDALLAGKRILVTQNGHYGPALVQMLKAQKAHVDLTPLSPLAGADLSSKGMAQNQPRTLAPAYQATLFDSTNFRDLADLKHLYTFFRASLRRLGSHHRICLLLAAPNPEASPDQEAVKSAIEGFARSLAKEVGPRGVNVNCIRVHPGKAGLERLGPICSFLLSDHAAFITGQFFDCLATEQARPIHLPALAGSLAGKRALVTGAAQGIGYAICRRLAEEGAHVLCLDRVENKAALQELAQAIDGETLEIDLTQPLAVANIVDRLQNSSAGLDILVHNAGITRDRSLFAMEDEYWDSVLKVNLEVVVELSQEILRRGQMQDGGRIICMSSISGLAGNFGQTNYSASKAGLIGYVKTLAHHLASQGITANAVAPGFIETSMTARVPFLMKQMARRFASLGQGGLPDDVADMVCFLASPCSQGLNGSVVRVCGGNFIGA